MLNKIILAHFSPTGGTRKAALYMAQAMAKEVKEIDFSLPNIVDYDFIRNDVVIFAVPVFGGRVPDCCLKKLKACSGNGTKAVTIVVYGGRHYDDALLELNDCVQEQGFDIVASLALIAEHSIYRSLAAGRPDASDVQEIQDFACRILERFQKNDPSPISVSGNRPYKEYSPLPIVPEVLDTCNHCGLCATKCPNQAILKNDEYAVCAEKCILCMRCVVICPRQARAIPAHIQKIMEQKLSPFLSVRRPNELF